MKTRQCLAAACSVALLMGTSLAAARTNDADVSTAREGLIEVKSTRFDNVYVLPGADFRGYTKVMLDPTQVALAEDWMNDINSQRIATLRRVSVEDTERITHEARQSFGDILSGALKSAGYEIVAAPGADVLSLSPRVIDLYVNAPKAVTTAPLSRVYTFDAGEATLVLEMRDSKSGALLERIVDHGRAGNRGNFRSSLRLTSPDSNRFDFASLFDVWVRSYVKDLEELRARSPLAMTVPTQK